MEPRASCFCHRCCVGSVGLLPQISTGRYATSLDPLAGAWSDNAGSSQLLVASGAATDAGLKDFRVLRRSLSQRITIA